MIFVDANALIYLLHNVKPKSDLVASYLEREGACTSLRVVEEATYVLIRVKATEKFGVRGPHQVAKIVERHGLGFVESELRALRDLLNEYEITVLRDRADVDELYETMVRYKLLPGDAIIALTCKHYGVKTILTFDEDFKRVPWLRVVP